MIKSIFSDFYGTPVHEDGAVIGRILVNRRTVSGSRCRGYRKIPVSGISGQS